MGRVDGQPDYDGCDCCCLPPPRHRVARVEEEHRIIGEEGVVSLGFCGAIWRGLVGIRVPCQMMKSHRLGCLGERGELFRLPSLVLPEVERSCRVVCVEWLLTLGRLASVAIVAHRSPDLSRLRYWCPRLTELSTVVQAEGHRTDRHCRSATRKAVSNRLAASL